MDEHDRIERARPSPTIDPLLEELAAEESGIGFIYSALDLLATRYRIRDAAVVLTNDSYGTQIFRLKGRAVSANLVAALGSHPGVYCTSDVVPQAELDAVYLACQQTFSSQFVRFNAAHSATAQRETSSDTGVLEPPVSVVNGTIDEQIAAASDYARVSRRTTSSRRLSHGEASRVLLSQFLILVDVAVFIMTVADVHGPVRFVLGLILGVVIPGWCVVGLLKLENPPLEFGLTLSVSASLLMIVAQLLMTVNLWHLVALEEVTCLVCLPSLIYQARLLAGQHPRGTTWVGRSVASLSSLRLPDFIHRGFTGK